MAFKQIFPKILLFLAIGALIAFSSFSALKKQNENELAYQKLLETEEKNYLMGKFDPAERKDFIHIPIKYTIGENGKYLRQETWDAFLKMHDQAEQDGIRLRIASATRNFDYQKNIWESKWKNFSANTPDGLERFKKILEWSSVPGTSRHHWGTDIDINSANASYFESEKGIREYIWLVQNAPSFGFCQPYNLKNGGRPMGYNEERWHWSYLPIARGLTEEYKNLIKKGDIKGFLGDRYVSELDLINNYVLSINPDCL